MKYIINYTKFKWSNSLIIKWLNMCYAMVDLNLQV